MIRKNSNVLVILFDDLKPDLLKHKLLILTTHLKGLVMGVS